MKSSHLKIFHKMCQAEHSLSCIPFAIEKCSFAHGSCALKFDMW